MALNHTYDARLLQQETTVGAGVQVLLLAVLGTATGMSPAGWLTGLAFALATWAVLTRAVLRSRLTSFGPANRVTLGRATLVGGVTALVAESFETAPPVTLFVGLTAIALILDGVDGKVARRTGTSSVLGARFDMEVDAFLILVLSVYVSMSMGPWVLLIGAMRYLFVAAARFQPWLDAPLPHSMARKTVAAYQGIALLAAASGWLPYQVSALLVSSALGWLVWSFGRDVGWLWGERAERLREGREETAARPLSGAVSDAGAGPASVSVPGMAPASPTSFSIPVPVPAGVTPLSQAAPADRGMPTALVGRA
ncbi:CDP-alcohol phosphatidyltransferase family protein [Streptomyces sp. ME02-6978a]|uniref:CDP-alcohol phosphatidyltransferase family protein n=1 Tax=unclassified Streptomyces TaxID=2593676 RepID=UPI0029BE33DA|nr:MULTISPECIES: CDP-alcohol phosphatidyltransferase family protein [unclassified Streptomyces]MDX3087017.1 CDP-alcohol phosphatidyltransferase family protein [Streptomyces sp. ME12-02E]MDX3330586.1 CDP-alcohol phosphatidyltransferase family protein [Streptomyces sp. ME02-6978a]